VGRNKFLGGIYEDANVEVVEENDVVERKRKERKRKRMGRKGKS